MATKNILNVNPVLWQEPIFSGAAISVGNKPAKWFDFNKYLQGDTHNVSPYNYGSPPDRTRLNH